MHRLKGAVAIVTGGAVGIGRAACVRLAEEGAAVAITDVREAEGHALAADIAGVNKPTHEITEADAPSGDVCREPGGRRGRAKALDAKHPLGHVGDPDDIAWGIVYLASDEAKFITGSEPVIDGGYTAQ